MPHNVIEQFLMDFSNLLWHYDFNETRISYFSFFPFLIFFLSFFFFNFKNFELQNFNDKILHCCTELYFTVLNSYTYLLFFFFFNSYTYRSHFKYLFLPSYRLFYCDLVRMKERRWWCSESEAEMDLKRVNVEGSHITVFQLKNLIQDQLQDPSP